MDVDFDQPFLLDFMARLCVSLRAGLSGTVREFEHFSDMGTYALMCVGLQECMRRVEGSWSLASSACGAKEVIELHIIHRIANVWWHIMEDLN